MRRLPAPVPVAAIVVGMTASGWTALRQACDGGPANANGTD